MLTIYNATLRAAMAKAVLEAATDLGEALAVVQVLSSPHPLSLSSVPAAPPTYGHPKPWEYQPRPITKLEQPAEKVEPAPATKTPGDDLFESTCAVTYDSWPLESDVPVKAKPAPVDLPSSPCPTDPPKTETEAKAQIKDFIDEHQVTLEALAKNETAEHKSKPAPVPGAQTEPKPSPVPTEMPAPEAEAPEAESVQATEQASSHANTRVKQPCKNPDCEKLTPSGGYCTVACAKDHAKTKEVAERLRAVDPKVLTMRFFQEVYPGCDRSEGIRRYGAAAYKFWEECTSRAYRELNAAREAPQVAGPEPKAPGTKVCALEGCEVKHDRNSPYCSHSHKVKAYWAERKEEKGAA